MSTRRPAEQSNTSDAMRGMSKELCDEEAMQQALVEARRAYALGEVPIGAIVHAEGQIVARARNATEQQNDPTAHAELLALRFAAMQLGSWKHLSHTTLTVTVEPCTMCAGAALQSRVARVVYGAPSPTVGGDGSWCNLLRGADHPLHPNISVRGGVLSQQCCQLMRSFFQQRRKLEQSDHSLEWTGGKSEGAIAEGV